MRRSLLVAAAAFLFAGVCARPEPRVAERQSRSVPAGAAPSVAARVAAPVAPAASEAPSVYDLHARLLDDRGEPLALDAFRGHPVLITMFYGSCQAACPLITADLKRIEQRLTPGSRANLRVLMVSFDPQRDTPAALSRMKAERGMDPARWTLANASDDDARDLAGVLGIHFRKLDNGQFFHSSAIILLDEGGRIRSRIDGLGHDPSDIVAAIGQPST